MCVGRMRSPGGWNAGKMLAGPLQSVESVTAHSVGMVIGHMPNLSFVPAHSSVAIESLTSTTHLESQWALAAAAESFHPRYHQLCVYWENAIAGSRGGV